jgi:tetratricopeptide (TPR) repeat protein
MSPVASAQSLQDRAAQYERDRAEIGRLEATRPEREAAERAANAQAAAQRAADDERSARSYWAAVAHASQRELDRQLTIYAMELFKHRDYTHAIAVMNRNLQISPDDSGLFGLRAQAKAALKDFDGAMQDIAQAVALSPKYRGVYLDRADVRVATGDISGAVADLELVMRTDPKDDDAYIRRARIREKQGDIPGALSDLQMAQKLDPNDKTYRDDLAVVQAKAQGREAPADAVARRLGWQPPPPVSDCDRLGSWPGDETRPITTTGVDETSLNAPAAVAACAAEVRANPAAPRSQFNLGRALEALGRCDDAKAMLQAASDAGNGAASFFLADLQNQGKCVTDPNFNPLPLFEKAAQQGNAWSAQTLGKIYDKVADQKKTAGAQAEYSAAVKIAHQDHGIAFDIWNKRAAEGDTFAMYKTAVYAYETGSEFAGYGKFEVIYRCIAHEITACYKYDTQ